MCVVRQYLYYTISNALRFLGGMNGGLMSLSAMLLYRRWSTGEESLFTKV